MATPKKSHTTKKTVAKKTPVKKASVSKAKGKVKARPLTWRFYVVTVGIFAVAVATMVVIALLASSVVQKITNEARLAEIKGIYNSLELGEEYDVNAVNVFGDKRLYSWDKGRTESSSIEYIHGDTVTNTVAKLDEKIKAAGFSFIDEPYPYPGMQSVQYHYKSAAGEYIRLTVQSKPYWDAVNNARSLGDQSNESYKDLDTNAGPSTVLIKVNLDDNNE